MTETEIEAFIAAFEDGSLPRSEWTHARHLIMALWYLRHYEREVATNVDNGPDTHVEINAFGLGTSG